MSHALTWPRPLLLAITLSLATSQLAAQGTSIAITTPPAALVVASAVAGTAPTPHTDQSARYAVNVASGRMKVVGQLDSPLPPGVTLTVELLAPSGAVSLGRIVLTTQGQDLVRFIPPGQHTGLPLTLALSASVSAGVIAYGSSSLVLTLVDDP